MSNPTTYTLAETTDLFMNARGITKKKYFPSYLIAARFVWKDIFKNTLFATKSEWLTVQRGDPFNYVDVPPGTERIFSVAVEDDCHNIVPLFYNNRMSVVKKPIIKKCGCTVCNCSGLCADANAMQMTTKAIFTIDEVNYYEKTWLETCKNGDVLEYKITPVKKYNTLQGNSGDFDNSYNADWSAEPDAPCGDFTIIYVNSQKKICKLEVAPCGCPLETPENEEVFNTFCGCLLDCCSPRKKRCCDDFLQNPNNNERGEVKLSECGTKLYYKPGYHWRQVGQKKIPDFLLVNTQTDGENCTQSVLVPEYALDCMFAGMNDYTKKYKDSVPYREKLGSGWQYEAARNKLILYLNPLSLEELAAIQDAPIRW